MATVYALPWNMRSETVADSPHGRISCLSTWAEVSVRLSQEGSGLRADAGLHLRARADGSLGTPAVGGPLFGRQALGSSPSSGPWRRTGPGWVLCRSVFSAVNRTDVTPAVTSSG